LLMLRSMPGALDAIIYYLLDEGHRVTKTLVLFVFVVSS
jgi:hypothetical protein